jgi:hypothetical protein
LLSKLLATVIDDYCDVGACTAAQDPQCSIMQ